MNMRRPPISSQSSGKSRGTGDLMKNNERYCEENTGRGRKASVGSNRRKKADRNNTRVVGNIYETLASDFLQKKGYHILERNYSNRFGEIDIIALYHPPLERNLPDHTAPYTEEGAHEKSSIRTVYSEEHTCCVSEEELLYQPGSMLVICEVKYRTHRGTGDPAEAVTKGKIRHICRTAAGYYLEHGLSDSFPCRFDVISILGSGELRHIEDAFLFIF